METGIIGHEKILDFFAKAVSNNRLSHAYCFVGPESVGKRAVAEKIAADLLQTAPARLKAHPDFVLVEQEYSLKKEKTNKDITVEQIRNLRQALARHSYLGGPQVALIPEAEKMNAEAANALLKTLEEPAGKTILFIITKDEAALPETIVSRCQLIYFQLVPKDAIALALPQSTGEMQKWSLGRPGQVKNWLANAEAWEIFKKETARFQNLLGKSFFAKLQAVDDLFKEVTDSVGNRERLQDVLNIWQLLIRDNCLKNLSLGELATDDHEPLPGEWEQKTLKQIAAAGGLLADNINPRLIFENILLTLP